MIVSDGSTIVVWFSCGAASAVAAKETLEKYGDRCTVRVVNNPIVEEDPDNYRFLKDVEKWLGVDIETATNPKYPLGSCVEVWDKRQFMSGPAGAPCTLELKKAARSEWESNNHHDFLVLGFTLEELKRHKNFAMFERDNILPVLIDAEISKTDCYHRIMQAGIELPNIYKRGYPNANCIGCVKASSPTYWNLVREQDPKVFQQRAEQSRRIGAKLVRVHPKHLPLWYKNDDGLWQSLMTGETSKAGVRVYLDELPPDVKGRPLKNLDFECGIFCEEKPGV